MNRSISFTIRTLAVIGAALIALAMGGCGTMNHPMSDDAQAGLIPSHRGAF